MVQDVETRPGTDWGSDYELLVRPRNLNWREQRGQNDSRGSCANGSYQNTEEIKNLRCWTWKKRPT